jgi:hypothetical protein
MTIRITEERARGLLEQCKWLLIACAAALVVFFSIVYSVSADFNKLPTIGWAIFATYWLAGVLYFIWLGRLAYGLGRSVIYYVGLTWVFSSTFLLFAHLIAYQNIKGAVNSAFGAKPITATT